MLLFASDLDQTLIFSRSFNERLESDIDLNSLVIIEYLNDVINSFMSSSSLALLQQISKNSIFIPATTRTIEQFQRILLEKNNVTFQYAITSNGGNILINGEANLDWNQKVKKDIIDNCLPFSHVHKVIEELNNKLNFLISSKDADDLFSYFIINKDFLPEDEVLALREYFETYNFVLSLQGRKLYVIPRFVDKSLALKEILKYTGKVSKILSAGDSFLDLPMLRFSDIGYIPSHGEIVKSTKNITFLQENLKLTDSLHYLASEEILKSVYSFLQNFHDILL